MSELTVWDRQRVISVHRKVGSRHNVYLSLEERIHPQATPVLLPRPTPTQSRSKHRPQIRCHIKTDRYDHMLVQTKTQYHDKDTDTCPPHHATSPSGIVAPANPNPVLSKSSLVENISVNKNAAKEGSVQ